MRDKAYIRSLLEYNTWANAEIYRVARALPAEELARKRPTPLESILVSLNHLLAVDCIWMAHLRGVDHGFDQLRPVLHADIEALWAARQEMDGALATYLDELGEQALEEEVTYELIGGNQGRLSRAMILTHLALHGSYHRGWIADMLGQASTLPPIMDIPVYERATREAGGAPLP